MYTEETDSSIKNIHFIVFLRGRYLYIIIIIIYKNFLILNLQYIFGIEITV